MLLHLLGLLLMPLLHLLSFLIVPLLLMCPLIFFFLLLLQPLMVLILLLNLLLLLFLVFPVGVIFVRGRGRLVGWTSRAWVGVADSLPLAGLGGMLPERRLAPRLAGG